MDGQKYLEKHSLLCPPGEPSTHYSLSIYLHQISAMAGVQKQTVNTIHLVAFLLEEMEQIQINETIREALDSQMTEFTLDMKTLIEDARERINKHVKTAEEHITKLAAPPVAHLRSSGMTYASVLVNPPAHANPRVAAREGIKARQFMIEGIKNLKFSHLDTLQLKTELNKILIDIGLSKGKFQSVSNSRSGGTVVEMDTDKAVTWLMDNVNQHKLCDKIGSNAEFPTRTFNIIAFNIPITISPEEASHWTEICEANGLEPTTIISAKWAKAVNRSSPNQRTAHLLLTFDNTDVANRAITNGLSICNKHCHVERTKCEPIRCLKCQGWNHYAKDCMEEKDTCGNCAGTHRTSICLATEKSCVSCKSNEHVSWSRTCLVFLQKINEFNARNPACYSFSPQLTPGHGRLW